MVDSFKLSSALNIETNPFQNIRSFVRREGRFTKGQKQALDNYWYKYGIDYQTSLLDFNHLFQRRAPLIMDIGVGTGNSTIEHAVLHPENNYLAIEVHRPGIGQLLNLIEAQKINNIRIINHDVIEVFKYQIPDNSVSQIFIFFPDPWPKKRHHKRRLINRILLQLIKDKIAFHGRLHIATDWQDYADHITNLLANDQGLFNLAGESKYAPRPDWRINTRYEARGLRLAHKVYDFCYCRR